MSRPRKYKDDLTLTGEEFKTVQRVRHLCSKGYVATQDEKKLLAKYAAWIRYKRGYSNRTDKKANGIIPLKPGTKVKYPSIPQELRDCATAYSKKALKGIEPTEEEIEGHRAYHRAYRQIIKRRIKWK